MRFGVLARGWAAGLLWLVLLTSLLAPAAKRDDNIIRYGRTQDGPEVTAEIEEEHRLSLEFATPHTKWAQPYAHGKMRVLFICESSRWDTLTREAEELMQRFDVSLEAVYGDFVRGQDPGNLWIGGKTGEQRMARLLRQPYDVILAIHISPQYLPPDARALFESAVKGGTGLVLLGVDDQPLPSTKSLPDDPEAIDLDRQYLPLFTAQEQLREPQPFLAGLPPYSLYQAEHGRVICLPRRPTIEYHQDWEVEYDYWQEALGRALLWAARREPTSTLIPSFTPTTPAWGAPTIATVEWENATTDGTLDVEVRLQDGRKLAVGSIPARTALGAMSFTLPPLPAGAHHLHVFLRSPRGTETWTVAPLTIDTSRTVRVALTQDWGEIGERITGQVTLAGVPLPNEQVDVQLLDRRGRILARADTPTFTFPIPAWMPMLVHVKAVLTSGGHEVTSANQYFHVTHRGQDRFNFVMWQCPVGTMAAYAQESMVRHGVTAVLGGGNPRLEQAAFDLPWVPYTTRLLNVLDKEHITEGGCWNNLAVRQPLIDKLVNDTLPARRHGVFVYSLGDEGVLSGSCLDPACTAAYRRFLQRSYGTIAALNASWGTRFASFDAVELSMPEMTEDVPKDLLYKDTPAALETPLPMADNDEALSLHLRNYPRWYDRLAFQRDNLVQYSRRFADAFRRNDPLARVGFEGTSGSGIGMGADVEALVDTLAFWGPYASSTDELIRGLAPRTLVRSNWMGYAKDADGLLSSYWRTLTRGADSIFWWCCTGVGSFHGFLAPDLAPYAATKEMLADTQIVRDGLGDLLLHCPRLHDGIALFYAMPSEAASGLEAGAGFGLNAQRNSPDGYGIEHAAWQQAIRAVGMQFTYVTDRRLLQAPLDPRDCKVLILPRAEALSNETAQAIRAYAEAGGTVIADVRPGLYTDHCTRRQTGCLDALFGITRTGMPEAMVTDMHIDGILAGRPLKLAWSLDASRRTYGAPYGTRVDPGVAATTGRTLGAAEQTPVCIVRPVGKGRAVLLNFTLSSCNPMPGTCIKIGTPPIARMPAPVADFLTDLLASAGVAPAQRLLDRQEQSVHNVEIIRWQDGDAQLITLWRTTGAAEPLRLTLPQPRYLYNLRTGKLLGHTAAVTVIVTPNRPTWLAALPAPAPAPRLTLDAAHATRGQVLHATLSVPNAVDRRAVRLRLTAPDGQDAEWAHRIIIAAAKPVEIPVPTAFNDTPGEWTLTATDLLGHQTSAKFTIAP